MKFQIAIRLLSRSQDAFDSASSCHSYKRSFRISLRKFWTKLLKSLHL